MSILKFSIYSISFSIALEKILYLAKLLKKYNTIKILSYGAKIFAVASVLISLVAISIFLFYIKLIDKGERVDKKEVIDPRIYMAAERTFLAWVRTAISITVFGFVIDKFEFFLLQLQKVLYLNFPIEPRKLFEVGAFIIGMGVITILLGITNFHRTVKSIDLGYYRTNVILYTLYGLLIFLTCLTLAVYVLKLI